MARRKAKKKVSVTCEYCEHFHSAKKRTFGGTLRFCPVKEEEVLNATEACSNFSITSYFWCKSCANRIHVQMCKSRRCKCVQKAVVNAGEAYAMSIMVDQPPKERSLPL